LKAGDSARPVILITAHGSVDVAVEAMKQGAEDFVTKPLDYSKLKVILDSSQRNIHLRRESQKLASQLEKGAGFGLLVGTGRRMREVYALLRSVATGDSSVIVTGESGTGKELAARTIHELSARSKGLFIAINAAAIPEGLIESEIFGHERGAFTGAIAARPGCFELADRGTLFLDEIAEMPLALQPKLLRVLEDGRVRRLGGRQEYTFNVRVLAATNQDPRTAVKNGKLREDLYYRLNVFTIVMPPLRERKEDLLLLVHHFIREFNRKHGMQVDGLREETLEMLKTYSWPGNVRELRNVIERAVILTKGGWVTPPHLPPYIQNPTDEPETKIVLPVGISLAEAEKELILKTLEKVGHNKAEAARQLGLDVKTIRNKLKSYGLDE
jgi:DNA-binding NtrC family response regulator